MLFIYICSRIAFKSEYCLYDMFTSLTLLKETSVCLIFRIFWFNPICQELREQNKIIMSKFIYQENRFDLINNGLVRLKNCIY